MRNLFDLDGVLTGHPVQASYDNGDMLAVPLNPQTDDELMARAVRILRNLTDWFGLTAQWAFTVVIDDAPPDATHAAEVTWAPLYKKAAVTLNRRAMNQLCDRQFVQYMAHEVLHLVLAPLDDCVGEQAGRKSYVFFQYGDTREGVVDSLTNLFMKAWDGGAVTFYTEVRHDGKESR